MSLQVSRLRRLSALLIGVLAAQAHAVLPSYNFTALSTLNPADPMSSSRALGISSTGMIVGDANNTLAPLDPSYRWNSHAVLWSPDGAIQDLGVAGGAAAVAHDINIQGQIVGQSFDRMGVGHAVLWQHPAASPTMLSSSFSSSANAINNEGWIVGVQQSSGNPPVQQTIWNAHQGDGAILVGPGELTDVNNRGVVVGVALTITGGLYTGQTGYVNDNGLDVSPSLTPFSFVSGVNEGGQLIGTASQSGNDGSYFPFVYDDVTGLTQLGTLGGKYTAPNAINSLGQVVGSSRNAVGQQHAVVWDGTQAIDLNVFLSPELTAQGWVLTSAWDINDSGVIVGEGSAMLGGTIVTRGFMLTPVPEAGSVAMMGLGLLGVAAAVRRRSTSLA